MTTLLATRPQGTRASPLEHRDDELSAVEEAKLALALRTCGEVGCPAAAWPGPAAPRGTPQRGLPLSL